jgi:hypothetical protein
MLRMYEISATRFLGASFLLLAAMSARGDSRPDEFKLDKGSSRKPLSFSSSSEAGTMSLSRIFKPRSPSSIEVDKAYYLANTQRLFVEATCSGSQAGLVLSVQDGKDGKVLGTLKHTEATGAYTGLFELETPPKSIKVVANGGGSATSKVKVIKVQRTKPAEVMDEAGVR